MNSGLKINTLDMVKEQYEKRVKCDSPKCDNQIPLVVAMTHKNTCMSCVLENYNSDIKLHNTPNNEKEK